MGPEHKYNVVLLGPVGVGKSALTVKYITKRFIMDYDPFIEGTYTKTDIIDNHEVLVKVRDTYLENVVDIGKYLKWADGFLVVYSVISRDSFEQIRCLLEVLRQHLRTRPVECPVVLVGNKSDLERCRQVSTTAGSLLATQFGCKAFCETSAAEEFLSVESAIHALVKEVQRERDGRGGNAPAASSLELPALFISEECKSMSLPAGSVAPKSGLHVRRAKTAKLGGTSPPADEQKRRGADSKKSPNSAGSSNGGGFRIFNKSFKIFS